MASEALFTSEAAVSASSQPLREWCRRPRGSMLFVKADESNSDAMGPSTVPTTKLGVLVCGWLPKGVTSGRDATCCACAEGAREGSRSCARGGGCAPQLPHAVHARHPVSLNTGRSHTYTATDTAHTRGGRAVAAPRGVFFYIYFSIL